jgi:NAD(P)-dependent dehydrogenase (short-subunit alcohol dehydrogenase family)
MFTAGQTLIITGASHGIGRAIALGLACRNLNLVLNARREGALRTVAEECRCGTANVAAIAGNVAYDEVAACLVETALEMGGFLGFVHSAAVLHPGPFIWEISALQQTQVLDAILIGGLSMIRHAVPPLLQTGRGLAVFLGSEAVEHHTPGLGTYSVANAAQEFLARQLAAETQVVTSFLFRPGAVDTRMQLQGREAKGGAAQSIRPIFRDYYDQGLLATPEQAAAVLIDALDGPWEALHGQELNARAELTDNIIGAGAFMPPSCPVSISRSMG